MTVKKWLMVFGLCLISLFVQAETQLEQLRAQLSLAKTYHDQAIQYYQQGLIHKALPLVDNSLQIISEIVTTEVNQKRLVIINEKHLAIPKMLNNFAVIYWEAGKISTALTLAEQSYFIMTKMIDDEANPNVLSNLETLAAIYQTLDRLEEALSLFNRVYRLRKKHLGDRNLKTIDSLNNVAAIHFYLNQSEKALALFERVYKLRKEILGENDPQTLKSLINLAATYQDLGRLREISSWLNDGYKVAKEIWGKKSPKTMLILYNLAFVNDELGNLDKALSLYEECYKHRQEILGGEHPDTILSLMSLAQLYLKQDDIDKGSQYLEKFVDGIENLLNNSKLSAENRRSFFQKWVEGYFLLSFVYITQRRPFDAFYLAEMSKARTLLESLATKLAVQKGEIPLTEQQLQKYEADLSRLNNRLALLDKRIAEASKNNRLEEKDQLMVEKISLETEKDQLVTQYRTYTQEIPIVTAKEGAKYLPNDSVLISYLRLKDEILAFTLQHDGKLTAHYLGAIPNLEEDVEIYRCQLVSFRGKKCQWLLSKEKTSQNSSSSLSDEQESRRGKKRRKRPSAHVQPAESLSRKLGKSLLEPLADIIKNKTHWIISPDGPLALIPFETLRFEGEEQPVIAKHQISYVQSLSVLKLLQERHKEYQNLKERKTLFAMGAPIYEVEKQTQKWTCAKNKIPNAQLSNGKISNHIGNPNREISTLAENPSAVDFKITRRLVRRGDDYARAFRQLGRGNWENLAGALKEVCELEKLFKDSQPHIYKLEEATEDKLRQLNKQGILAQSRYLVFATHGYLSLQVPALSSVVLGEANNPSSEIDGYVTAAEWTGYNLKSDLMVLSACV
jgi:CHAT domain-containing protein